MMLPKVARGVVLAAVGLVAASAAPARAGLILQYQLNGSYASDLGGPSLVPLGGTLGATGYTFGADQGLTLSNALPNTGNYSIEMLFRFDTLTGYRRILDFKDRASDTGLYDLDTALNFYNITTGPTGSFAPSTIARVVVTRDEATNLFVGYVNGVQRISFTDSSSLGVFTGTNGIIRFFQDDLSVPGESSAGFVDQIRIYDAPLTAAQVAALQGVTVVTPAPPTAAVLVAGLAAWGGSFRLRRRTGAPVV